MDHSEALGGAATIVVSGELGAGKTTTARYLASHHGFEHLSFVDRIWTPILKERKVDLSRAALQQLGIELMRTHGPERLVDMLLAYQTGSRVVIDDARRVDVVQLLRDRRPRLTHVHLLAEFATRFPRLQERDGVESVTEQAQAEAVETETSIAELADVADYVVENDGDREHLYAILDGIVASA